MLMFLHDSKTLWQRLTDQSARTRNLVKPLTDRCVQNVPVMVLWFSFSVLNGPLDTAGRGQRPLTDNPQSLLFISPSPQFIQTTQEAAYKGFPIMPRCNVSRLILHSQGACLIPSRELSGDFKSHWRTLKAKTPVWSFWSPFQTSPTKLLE